MLYEHRHRLSRTALQCTAAAMALALLTFLSFRLQLNLATAACLYLLVSVLLSLQGSALVSIVASIGAAGCLMYFFAVPIGSFRVSDPFDAVAIVTFFACSAVVAYLVYRVRKTAHDRLAELERRRGADDALKMSEAYLAEAQRLSHTGSFGWRVSTHEILWSEETFRIFQYDPAMQPTLKMVLDRIHPGDVKQAQAVIQRAAQDGVDFEHEYRLLLPDGAVKHVHVVAHASGAESANLQFVGAVMDVTAARQAEDALRASEQQWRDVFENNPTMYFMIHADGTVIAVNPFGAQQLGYAVDELVGGSVFGVFHPADCAAVRANVASCLERMGRSLSWELRKIRRDGSVMSVRETARAVLRGGEPVILIACEDITERKRAEEALRRAQEELSRANRVMLLGEMVASIAHEINQPLTGVIAHAGTCLRWLEAQPPNVEEARHYLGLMVRDGRRAGEVIERIRGLVRKVPPHSERLNVREAILEVIALAQNDLQRHAIRLQARLASDLPEVSADRVQLQQVILNLIVNAIEAMSAVGERSRDLLVSCGVSGPDVFVEIRDSGEGFHPADLQRLFASFYTTKPHGMGMGLSISRSIIEAHGGQLTAAANEPQGAVFRFTLPTETSEGAHG